MLNRNIGVALGFAVLAVLGSNVYARAAAAGSNSAGFIYNYNRHQFSLLPAFPFPFGINDGGDIVGVKPPVTACLLLSGGSITTIVPEQGAQKCAPVGINGGGTVVGWYLNAGSAQGAFLANGSNITLIDNYPGCFSMDVTAINNAGQVTGSCTGIGQAAQASRGFIREANGQTTLFSVPRATSTSPAGIDASGDIVGMATLPGGNSSAFFYSHGSTRTLVFAACETAEVTAMSNEGRIVGNCRQTGSYVNSGFLMASPSSPVEVFRGPNGAGLLVRGVNDSGQIVGMM